MKLGRLLIAAVLLAALAGGIWWANKKEKTDADKPAAPTSPKVLTLVQDDVREIQIKHREGDPTVVRKDDAGKWQVTAPKSLPGDPYAIGNLTSAFADLSSDRLVDEKVADTDLNGYGLAPAAVELDITMKDGKKTKLLIGEENATGNGVYVKLDGDSRLFIAASSIKSNLDKNYRDLRDRHLLNFEQGKISRIELTAKKGTVEFGRTGPTDWQILKPRPMRADGFSVEDLIRQVRDGVLENVTDEEEKKAPGLFASGQPVAAVKITDASGTQTLEVRKNKDDFYVKSSVVQGIQKVNKDLGAGVDKGLDDFVNKKLFDIGQTEPSRIEFKDGDKSATYEKSGEKWLSGGKTMDTLSVLALVDKLRDLSATKLVDGGFTKPEIYVTVVSNDAKRTDKVQISQSAGNKFIARREGDSTMYELDAMTIQDLRQIASDIKEPQAPAKPVDKKK